MKTVRITMLFICIAFFAIDAKAQTNYYMETRTFYEDGFTFQADFERSVDALLRSGTRSANLDMSHPHGRVILYNKSNRLRNVEQRHRDGSLVRDCLESPPVTADDVMETRRLIRTIFRNALSAEEKQRIGNHRLGLTLFVNPDTGEVMEVEFRFNSSSPFATIPVSVFRQIELDLKEQVNIPATPFGRTMNFLRVSPSFFVNYQSWER